MADDMSADQQPPGPLPWTGPWADDARRLFRLLQTVAEKLAETPEPGVPTEPPETTESSETPEPAEQPEPAEPPGSAGSSGSGESADGTEAAPPGEPGEADRHPPECLACPFCQGVALLRRAGPDVLDQLSEFAAGLAATLRATEAARGGPDPGTADPSGVPAGERSSPAARPPSTVRIDVTD
jgi:hypothetical protein